MNILPLVIPEQQAAAYREQMKKPNLLFMTRMNEKEIQAACNHDFEEIVAPAIGDKEPETHTVCKLCLLEK